MTDMTVLPTGGAHVGIAIGVVAALAATVYVGARAIETPIRAVTPAPVVAEPPALKHFSFKDFPLDSTLDEAQAGGYVSNCGEQREGHVLCDATADTLGGEPVRGAVLYINNEPAWLSFSFHPSRHETVRQNVIGAYGEPGSSLQTTVRHDGQAPLANVEDRWPFAGGVLTLRKYGDAPHAGSFLYRYDNNSAQLAQRPVARAPFEL